MSIITNSFEPLFNTGTVVLSGSTPGFLSEFGGGYRSIAITNLTTDRVSYVRIGVGSTPATSADFPVLPGSQIVLKKDSVPVTVSYVTPSGGGQLEIISGQGYSKSVSTIYPFTILNLQSPVLPQLSVSPAAAYSLRKLSPSATRAINVRRSSDNATQDIGFVGGNLDVDALVSFVGGNNGFVTTWYDQVGSNNATQATAVAQPIIVNAGSVVTDGGKPAAQFSSAQYLTFIFSHSGTLSSCCVGRVVPVSPTSGFFQIGGLNTFGSLIAAGANFITRGQASTGDATISYTPDTRVQLSSTIQTGDVKIWKNGVLGTSGAGILNSAISQVSTLGSLADIYQFDGTIQEINLFNVILSTVDRQVLERNQGAYYAISVA